MQELIKIDSTPAAIQVNFEQLQEALKAELEKYDVVVTQDGVKDAKTMATTLNKTAQEIDRRRKEEVAKVSEPIKAFEANMNTLKTMSLETREKILAQIKQFEDETRETVRVLLTAERDRLWAEQGVDPEHQRAEIDDLVLISNLTSKGGLTKNARESIEARASKDKARQDQQQMRLHQLEAASYKAGLTVPLTRAHVEPFLHDDVGVYEEKLHQAIETEKARQEQAEQAAREKIEREAREKAEAEQRAQAQQAAEAAQDDKQQPAPSEPKPEAEPAPTKSAAPAGKISWTVTATFEIEAAEWVEADTIRKTLEGKLQAAGFESLTGVQARRAGPREQTQAKAG